MNKKSYALALILILSVLAVQAAEQQVIPQQVCACGLTVESFRIVNDGADSRDYSIELAGDAAAFSVAYPPEFRLPSGGAFDIKVHLRFPCTVDKAYVLSIKVHEEDARTRTLTKAYVARTCPNIQVYATDAGQTAYPCQETKFRFDITNAGSTEEGFSFSVPQEYVTLSTAKVSLGPGRTHTLFADVNIPCEVSGLQQFALITETRDSGLKATTPFVLDVYPSYEYSLDGPKRLKLCEGVEKNVSLVIENEEDFDNSYSLSLTGTDWLPAGQELELAGEDSEAVELSFNAPLDSRGTYDVTVTALSEFGNVEKNLSFPVVVEPCYEFNLTVDVPEDKVCCDIGELPVLITNLGTEDFTVALQLEGLYSLADESLVIESGEEAWTSLLIGGEACPATGDFKLTATVEDVPGFDMVVSGNPQIVPVADCSRLEVLQTDFAVNYYHASITVPIENVGAKETYYYFTLAAGDWEFLETFDVLLAPGETGEVQIYIDPRDVPEDTYALDLTAETAAGEMFSTTLLLSLKEKVTFTGIMWESYVYIVNYTYHFLIRLAAILFLAVLALLVLLSVWRNKTRKIRMRATLKKWVRALWYLLLVMILGVVVVLLYANYGLAPVTTYIPENMTPENETAAPVPPESEFVIEIPRTGEFRLNLTNVFQDPDADVLYYTVVGPNTMDIEVDNENAIATIDTSGDFVEGSTITVTVSDGEYAIASPPISLIYAPEEEEAPSTSGISGILVYIILVLVVVFLFVRVLYDEYKEKKDTKKPKTKLRLSDMRGVNSKKRKK